MNITWNHLRKIETNKKKQKKTPHPIGFIQRWPSEAGKTHPNQDSTNLLCVSGQGSAGDRSPATLQSFGPQPKHSIISHRSIARHCPRPVRMLTSPFHHLPLIQEEGRSVTILCVQLDYHVIKIAGCPARHKLLCAAPVLVRSSPRAHQCHHRSLILKTLLASWTLCSSGFSPAFVFFL